MLGSGVGIRGTRSGLPLSSFGSPLGFDDGPFVFALSALGLSNSGIVR
jgi:hypothetical protein